VLAPSGLHASGLYRASAAYCGAEPDQTLWIQVMAIQSHKTGKGVLTDKSNPTV
jgi:hypothetical protein